MGTPIRIAVEPDAVVSVRPEPTVVTQSALGPEVSDIRAETCDHGFFYASGEAAEQWRRAHPGGEVRSVRDFFAMGLAAGRELAWIA